MRVDRVAGVDLPELQDRAVTVEQVRHPGGEGAAFPAVDQNAEFAGELLAWIGDERVRKPFLLTEFGVELRRVHARAEDLDAGFAKLLVELVETPGLARSAAGQRRRVEEDNRHSRQRRRQPLHREAQVLARSVGSVTFEHVPRSKNVDADRLANQAMDEATSPPQGTS